MRLLASALFALSAIPAQAQVDDSDALLLADKAPTLQERASDLTASVEGSVGSIDQRYGLPREHTQRTSLDMQYDKTLSKNWRVLLSDRLDLNSSDQFKHQSTVNTLREAYLSWQASDNHIVDGGRINARNGVAIGYNPTDYFRDGALRSISSITPASLKKNRLGSVMLRGQQLWNNGSFTALYSPKISTQSSDASFSADLGATNNRNRWLLSLSQKISNDINPQWMIYGEEHHSPQVGTNLTYLVTDAAVSYIEWSGGRSKSLSSQLFNTMNDEAFRSRLSTGVTYTTDNKISYTLEYDYNGAGMDKNEWNALRKGAISAYTRYRTWAQNSQDPATKQSVFFYSAWQDAMMNHLDVSGMVRYNLQDNSRMSWLEARHHWDHADLALQWQRNSGSAGSVFGALPQTRTMQIVGTYFFH